MKLQRRAMTRSSSFMPVALTLSCLAAGAAALPVVSGMARAQTYPTRQITLVVTAVAGGTTDTIGRIMAERMRGALGQAIILENNGNAAGSIAVGRVVRASPDGYTLGIGNWATHVVNGAVYQLQYDLLRDLEPISLISTTPFLLVAKGALPPTDLQGLVAWLKANPGKATFGTAGAGSAPHLGGVFFQTSTGTEFQYIPYRGGAPIVQDLLAGQVDISMLPPDLVIPYMRTGGIKAYAVMAKSRLGVAPDVPTVDEAGLAGLYLPYWHGLWAPKATPVAIIARLNSVVVDALADPTVRARLADFGQEIFPANQQTPEALGALQKSDMEKWWPIIKAANIKP
jgi:tripartite-type tricarboxylate transporter receptor subunit TctC